VGIQYKGKTLLVDNDVKTALDDCYAQKKLFLEVDLIGGGGGASYQAAEPTRAAAATAPVTRSAPAAVSVPPLATRQPEVPPVAVDQVAGQLLSKYGLTSPRDRQAAAAAPSSSSAPATTSPRRVASPREQQQYTAPAPAPAPVKAESPRRAVASSASSSGALRSGIEADVRSEINRLRSDPASFVDPLEKRRQAYEGATLRLKRGNVTFRSQTHEGAAAVADAIRLIRGTRPVQAVEFRPGLCEAARDIITFMGPEGARKPSSEDMAAMIDRRGQYEGTLSQVIAYVYEDDVAATVLDLLVCDGDKTRHTAHLLLNAEYRFAGAALSSPAAGAPRLLVMQFVSDSWVDL
jgi:hypothetical protein